MTHEEKEIIQEYCKLFNLVYDRDDDNLIGEYKDWLLNERFGNVRFNMFPVKNSYVYFSDVIDTVNKAKELKNKFIELKQ